jgi:hypothetical protein
MNPSFEYINHLEYQLKASRAEVRAFRPGKKLLDIQEKQRKEREALFVKVYGSFPTYI